MKESGMGGEVVKKVVRAAAFKYTCNLLALLTNLASAPAFSVITPPSVIQFNPSDIDYS